ncbi:MAG: DUF3343 domain-containing protein [Desulfovibrio sp.]|nr:DUF3343 domain-containing protein [Desulfovibrio sp.]
MSFQHTGEVIRAETILAKAGFSVEVMGPPPWMRHGCDMGLVCRSVEEPALRRRLEKEGLFPEGVHPISADMLEPVSLLHTVDFGDWFMVRAANMKITVEKKTGRIVNISGGGCPDVPYLAALLSQQSIVDSKEPRMNGQTLCSYALQKAFQEARRSWLAQNHG